MKLVKLFNKPFIIDLSIYFTVYFIVKSHAQLINFWMLVDMFNLITFINIFFTLISLLCFTLMVISHSALLMFRRLNQYLALQQLKLICKKFPTPMLLAWKLSVFRREHYKITSVLVFANKTLFNSVIISFFMTNLPFNICITTLLVLGQTPEIGRRFLLTLVIQQLLGSSTLFLLIAKCNSSIYSCKKYLVSLQSGLNRNQLRDKIHNLQFYELVHYKQDIGFSVGIFGVITKQKLHEVCSSNITL